MTKHFSYFLAFSFAVSIVGCVSQKDEYFPEFSAQPPIIVSINNRPVLVDGAYRPSEICRVDSTDIANRVYNYLRDNYNGEWETVNFTNYAPRYHVEFGSVRIDILRGGMQMRLPRPSYLFAYKGEVTFVKFTPESETFKLLRHVCPHADPAGPNEKPAVEVAIRNMSGDSVSDVTVAGGGQTRSLASIEPLQTAKAVLIPESDADLELSFTGSAADRFNCPMSIFLTPSMNGEVDIDINDDLECDLRRDSTSLY
jgi:hypothetical protein